jgi:diaminopimelate epimerase
MTREAFKYQGAGNDFIIFDNRDGEISLSSERIKELCDRRFGIGADGLMLLEKSDMYAFSMRYFNSDGGEGTMCGNGGRCLVAFAARKGIKKFVFEAVDGIHSASIPEYSPGKSIVELGMIDVTEVKEYSPKSYILNTGSPHLVIFVEKLKDYDVLGQGKLWRHHPQFPDGTNVNFVQGNWGRSSIKEEADLAVRTFERGVEDETYACGTGVTASAIAFHKLFKRGLSAQAPGSLFPEEKTTLRVQTLKNILEVSFRYLGDDHYTDIRLTGPATFVFSCRIEI